MKVVYKPVALFCVVMMVLGCAPKVTVKYDVTSGNKITAFENKKLGVMVLEDSRPKSESDGSSGGKISFPDTRFEKPVPLMVTDLVVNHFEAVQGKPGSVVRVDSDSRAVNIESLDKVRKEGLSDYVLLGDIKHYSASLYDEHYGIRMVGSFIAGFTLVGLVFMPLILAGSVDVSSEVELDNMLLVNLEGPQIMWKGRGYSTSKEEATLVSANGKDLIRAYEANTKKAIENLHNSIALSSELGFPQKYSIEDSKKILNFIKMGGSVGNLNF